MADLRTEPLKAFTRSKPIGLSGEVVYLIKSKYSLKKISSSRRRVGVGNFRKFFGPGNGNSNFYIIEI